MTMAQKILNKGALVFRFSAFVLAVCPYHAIWAESPAATVQQASGPGTWDPPSAGGAREVPLREGAVEQDTSVRSYRQRKADATPQSVLAWLEAGNRRFVTGQANHGGFPTDAQERVRVTSRGQRPLAIVLSCIDSRTAPEVVFDTSVGDLFTIRVAGNVINDDVLGSLEVTASSGAVIVVLGHTDCYAIKAAYEDVKLGHLTQLLKRVKRAIVAVGSRLKTDPTLAQALGEPALTNRRYIAEVCHVNAMLSSDQIRKSSPLLREQLDRGEIMLVSAIYDVDSGRVTFDSVK